MLKYFLFLFFVKYVLPYIIPPATECILWSTHIMHTFSSKNWGEISWKKYIFLVTTITKAELWLWLSLLSQALLRRVRGKEGMNTFFLLTDSQLRKGTLDFLKFQSRTHILQVNIDKCILLKQETEFLIFIYQDLQLKIQRQMNSEGH